MGEQHDAHMRGLRYLWNGAGDWRIEFISGSMVHLYNTEQDVRTTTDIGGVDWTRYAHAAATLLELGK